MIHSSQAIVLGTLKYGEGSLIGQLYTLEHGLVPMMIQGLKSKSALIRPSYLQPLSILRIEYYYKSNREIQRLKEARCEPVLHGLQQDLRKSSVAIFMAELLTKVTSQGEPDPQFFQQLADFIKRLDQSKSAIANWPVFFLVKLADWLGLGIAPYEEGQPMELDMAAGRFVQAGMSSGPSIDSTLSADLNIILQSTAYDLQQAQVSLLSRKELSLQLLRYLHLHLGGLSQLRSLKVLSQIWA